MVDNWLVETVDETGIIFSRFSYPIYSIYRRELGSFVDMKKYFFVYCTRIQSCSINQIRNR
jgi:hypothetical protein